MVVEQGQPQAVVARNRGIAAGQMNRWLADYKTNAGAAFPGKGKLRPEDERVRALEAQVKRLTTERERDLKKGHGVLRRSPEVRDTFIRKHRDE